MNYESSKAILGCGCNKKDTLDVTDENILSVHDQRTTWHLDWQLNCSKKPLLLRYGFKCSGFNFSTQMI